MKRGVFLDRDGVINRTLLRDGRPYAPVRLDDLEILPGVPESLRALRQAGFRLIVVTNQPDISRGSMTREILNTLHRHLLATLDLDAVKVCCHVDEDDCCCRKPRPGMILEAAAEWGLDLAASYLVGDRWRDIEAGQAAGCKTVWIRSDYAERQPRGFDAEAPSLQLASQWILADRSAPSFSDR